MSLYSLKFSEALPAIKAVMEQKLPIMIRGRHGIGKSQIVYQLAAELGAPVIEQRASQMTEGDLLGLPSAKPGEVGNIKTTEFNPPAWFARACSERVVLFLDEVDRATREVRQGLFQLNDSRRIGRYELHPETMIIAAVNGGMHGHNYQVNELDPAELDRYFIVDVHADFVEWKTWAVKQSLNPLVISFVENHQQYFESKQDPIPNEIYPSPRSWDRFSSVLGAKTSKKEIEAKAGTVTTILAGFCGLDCATSFVKFVRNQKAEVTLKEALNDYKLLDDYLKELSPEDRFVKMASLVSDLESQDWIPYIDCTKVDKQKHIQASKFLNVLHPYMLEHKDLLVQFLAVMLRGTQKNILEKLNNSSEPKEVKEQMFNEIVCKLKMVFSQGMTVKEFADKDKLLQTEYSEKHPICQALVAAIESNPEIADKLNQSSD